MPFPPSPTTPLIIIDDTNKREARAADALFARMVPGFELVIDLRTPRNHHPTWWNGIQVFRFRRVASTPMALPDPGAPFWVRRLLYDSIALNFKHRRRAFNRRVKDLLRARSDRKRSPQAEARLQAVREDSQSPQHRFVARCACRDRLACVIMSTKSVASASSAIPSARRG